jgi:hypothetical protein
MAWTMRKRNELIAGADTNVRCRVSAWHLKDALLTAGWTLRGSGTGTAGPSGDWTGTDYWVAAPTRDLCWVGLENSDSTQMLLQCSTDHLFMWWLHGAYTGAGAATATLPDRAAPLAGEVVSYYDVIDGARGVPVAADFYLQVATEGTTSFWAWATTGAGVVAYATALLRLENTKVTDTNPYWSFRNAQGTSATVFSTGLTDSGTRYCSALHPLSVAQSYPTLDLQQYSAPVFTLLPVDPNSGNEQLLECLVGCATTPYRHVKGKAPGLLRCSSARAVGDTFNTETYVCVGGSGYALPWSAGAAML